MAAADKLVAIEGAAAAAAADKAAAIEEVRVLMRAEAAAAAHIAALEAAAERVAALAAAAAAADAKLQREQEVERGVAAAGRATAMAELQVAWAAERISSEETWRHRWRERETLWSEQLEAQGQAAAHAAAARRHVGGLDQSQAAQGELLCRMVARRMRSRDLGMGFSAWLAYDQARRYAQQRLRRAVNMLRVCDLSGAFYAWEAISDAGRRRKERADDKRRISDLIQRLGSESEQVRRLRRDLLPPSQKYTKRQRAKRMHQARQAGQLIAREMQSQD